MKASGDWETLAGVGMGSYNWRAPSLLVIGRREVRKLSEEPINPELTIREAAKLLGVRPKTLRSYIKSGELESRGSRQGSL